MTMENNKFEQYLLQSDKFKDPKILNILEKISKNKKITKKEIMLLESLSDTIVEPIDYSHLSKNRTHEVINQLLIESFKVMCDLTDRDGKISEFIISVENNFENEYSLLNLENGKIANLEDKFLYNINWKLKKNYYSLTTQGEYFEKITIEK
jgi:hypothetical protein